MQQTLTTAPSDNASTATAIYLHWPFCVSKCPYCDFASTAPATSDCARLYRSVSDKLLDELTRDIDFFGIKKVSSIFFGGGTPSLMDPTDIERILSRIFKVCHVSDSVEISLEANPGTFDRAKISDLITCGINRLSVGIQSFSESSLRFLSRTYDSKTALAAADIVANKFTNFNFDFMYGYSAQTPADLARDLELATNFSAPHLSFYQLTFEENTPFYERMRSGAIKTISDDTALALYSEINTFLLSHDIFRYEISNYARKGSECRHNLHYWNYEDYLGVGPSSHSRLSISGQKHEIIKPRDTKQWLESGASTSAAKALSAADVFHETLIMGLRTIYGVNMKRVSGHIDLRKVEVLEKSHLAYISSEGNLILSDEGFLKLDSVVDFLV